VGRGDVLDEEAVAIRAYGKDGGVRLGRVGAGRETHYVINGTVMCGRYTKLSGDRESSEIETIPTQEGEHIEATCIGADVSPRTTEVRSGSGAV